jgi:hypothetical protein
MHFASQAHRQTVPRGEMDLSSFLIAFAGWSSTPAMRALGSQIDRIASMRGAEAETTASQDLLRQPLVCGRRNLLQS